MSFRREIPWTSLAVVGAGLVAAHRALPPGHPAAGVGHNLAALGEGWTLPAAMVAALCIWFLLPLGLPRLIPALAEASSSARRRALRPLALALGAILTVLPLEPLFLRCPLPSVARGATLVGCLAVAWRAGALAGYRERIPSGHGLALLVTIVLVPVALAWPAPQGDEPHYLLAASSIVRDGDLDLASDYAEERYRDYHPSPLSPHYKPGRRPGSRYSMHGPGYPVALLPGALVGHFLDWDSGVIGSRLLQVGLYGLFVGLLFGTLRDRIGSRAAAFGTLGTAGLAPFLFAPLHLFPETLLMLLGLTAYRWIDDGRPAWLAGLPLAVMPWLAVKTIPLAMVLALGVPWIRRAPGLWRSIGVAAPLVGSILLHGLFTWNLYGSWSPSALYLGAEPGFGRQPGYGAELSAYLADWPGALRTFIGYWIDQKEGLLFTGPHWLLALAGLPWMWRHRRRELLVLAAATLAYVGPYALSQQIGGQSPPARPLMAVCWMLAWPLSIGLAVLARPSVAWLRGASLTLGGALTVTFLADPRLLPHDYPVTSSWLLRSLSPHGWHLDRLFPLWLNVRGEWPWAVATLWLVGLGALGWWCVRGVGPLPEATRGPLRPAWAGATAAAVAVAAIGLFSARTAVTDRHVGAEQGGGVTLWVEESIPERAWVEDNGAWLSAGRREVVVTSRPSLDRSRLSLRAIESHRVELELPAGTRRIDVGRSWSRVDWRPPPPFESGFGAAWLLAVDSERAISPAEVLGGEDHRRLSALVRVEREGS